MKQLLNTLYITKQNSFLGSSGENIDVKTDGKSIAKIPLQNLESIVSIGWQGVSPALLRKCEDHNVSISFVSKSGYLQGRIIGELNGNVILRRQQYRYADDQNFALNISKNMIAAKIYNHKYLYQRYLHDHALLVNIDEFSNAIQKINTAIKNIQNANSDNELRGIEGDEARSYFKMFNHMILKNKTEFNFTIRTKRPPLDKVNALLSFGYTLLAHECATALETAGLDSYVGFMHTDRSGRISLALDLMEEFRAVYVDRYVLNLINKQIIKPKDIVQKETGACLLTDDARKLFIDKWQERKDESIIHPYLKEKISWGLLPYCQAMILARYIRGDLDTYPPFLMK